MNPANWIVKRLGRGGAIAVLGILLVLNLVIPDPLPFVDEALLGVLFAACFRRGGDEEE